MFKSLRYVLKENFTNLYRIYSISKYELLADMRDSKLGLFWNFANPTIQVLTYWLVFGIIMTGRTEQDGVPYICWLLGGIVVWFYISPCITNGCNAIYSKINVITKMKFPVSILPATVILKELFNHLCLMVVLLILFILFGFYPNIHWLGLIYYLFCAAIFSAFLSKSPSSKSCSCTFSKPSRVTVSANRSPVIPCSRNRRIAFSTTSSTSFLSVNTLSRYLPCATFFPQRPPI